MLGSLESRVKWELAAGYPSLPMRTASSGFLSALRRRRCTRRAGYVVIENRPTPAMCEPVVGTSPASMQKPRISNCWEGGTMGRASNSTWCAYAPTTTNH